MNEIDFERLTDFAGWDGHTSRIPAVYYGIEPWWEHLTPLPRIAIEDMPNYVPPSTLQIWRDFCDFDQQPKNILPALDNKLYERVVRR